LLELCLLVGALERLVRFLVIFFEERVKARRVLLQHVLTALERLFLEQSLLLELLDLFLLRVCGTHYFFQREPGERANATRAYRDSFARGTFGAFSR
jgi:hypothetical protein